MHSRWLKTRRHFYESLRQEILMITGELSEDLVQYQSEYENIFEKVWDVSSMDDLLSKMLSAKIVLAGDFHYFYQSQRTHYRILRELKKKIDQQSGPQKISLMLEVFDFKDQKKIDDYLNSKIDFQTLLKKTKWNKKWNQLPSHGYEVLLAWAKVHCVSVYGINDSSLDQLSERDYVSGEKINELTNENPNGINYIIYGDFHLAEAHLPIHIQSYNPDTDMILYLNSDKLYFALSEHAIEDQFDVLKLDNKFCVLSSTPWVKLQSYLVYLQEMDDQMISEVEDDDDFDPDYTDYLGKILDIYASDFEFQDWKKYLNVLTPGDLAFEQLDFLKLNKLEKEKLGYFVTSQKNIVFPKDQMQFLAKPSVNSAYSLVGEFIHSQLSQRESLNWGSESFMTKRIWIEAVSFFFNLWLNPTVKSLNESDLTARLRAIDVGLLNDPAIESEDYAEVVLRYAIDYRLTEVEKMNSKDRSMVSNEVNWKVQLEASGILGKIMGKKLYKSFKSGKMNRETLLSYLSVSVESLKFEAMYNHLLVELDKV